MMYDEKRVFKSNIAYFVHVDFHNLVHFFDLDLNHVQVLEYVDKLLVSRVIPVFTILLHLDYLIFHVFVVLDMFTQLMSVAAFTHTF